ncbi:unnamed protein product [Periconia digitata]|uniref:Uncharacterized protein n=1 Tax=Periconia digitata TaxID=1303443 RepID=A0A9W4XJV8_9PLEO|nr:unnamed protein product [Periconia digitata]
MAPYMPCCFRSDRPRQLTDDVHLLALVALVPGLVPGPSIASHLRHLYPPPSPPTNLARPVLSCPRHLCLPVEMIIQKPL